MPAARIVAALASICAAISSVAVQQVDLSPGSVVDPPGRAAREEWQRFEAQDDFKRAVAGVVRPGAAVVVTADSLQKGVSRAALPVMEAVER